jgi:acyl-CoA thioester hydrolase
MYTSETQIRVRYAETDQMDVVYYGNYAQYFEVGRVEAIRQLGLSYKDMEAAGVILPVVELTAKFLRPAHYDDLLTVRTSLRELPADHRILFHQEVINEAGTLLTAGKVLLYFVKKGTMEKTTMPAYLAEKLAPYFDRQKTV